MESSGGLNFGASEDEEDVQLGLHSEILPTTPEIESEFRCG